MSDTKKSPLKDKRVWEDELNAKLRYAKRVAEEEEARYRIKNWKQFASQERTEEGWDD